MEELACRDRCGGSRPKTSGTGMRTDEPSCVVLAWLCLDPWGLSVLAMPSKLAAHPDEQFSRYGALQWRQVFIAAGWLGREARRRRRSFCC